MALPRAACAAVVVGVSLFGAPAFSANLLVNPSFETGAFVNQGNDTMSPPVASTAITGWTVVSEPLAWIGPTNPFGLTASDGSYFLDLTNYHLGAPFSGVTQTIATVAGATYSLSFDLGGSNRWGRPDGLTASAGNMSMTFTTPSTGTNNDWYHETMKFVALGSTTAVTLQGQSGFNYIGLDNTDVELVSLPVPEPGTWLLLAVGLGVVAGRARRAAVNARRSDTCPAP